MQIYIDLPCTYLRITYMSHKLFNFISLRGYCRRRCIKAIKEALFVREKFISNLQNVLKAKKKTPLEGNIHERFIFHEEILKRLFHDTSEPKSVPL